MDRTRVSVLTAVGVLISLAGVLVLAPAALGPFTPMLQQTIESVAGDTGLALAVIGLATAVVGAVIASQSETVGPSQPDLVAITGGLDSTATGSGFDERLAALTAAIGRDDHDDLESSLREEVRETAVTVLARAEGLTPAEARKRLEDGSWTADPQAAAFFSPMPPPALVRLGEWLRAPPGVEQRLEEVISELESRLGLDREGTVAAASMSPDGLGGSVTHRVDIADRGADPEERVEASVRASGDDEGRVVSVGSGRRFGLGVGLAVVAVGLVTSVTTPFLLGLLAVGYSVTKYLTSVPSPEVELTRVLASDSPVPGDLVEVELSVENVGEQPLLDLRVVDGAPHALEIVEGSPSMATSLQPGETRKLGYTLQAKRGTFTFGDIEMMVRDLANVQERSMAVTVPTRLTGATRLSDPSLREQASQRIGAVKTDQGGSGVEFYGTREYRPGDPLNRVNWNQLAKTGELSTVEFRKQRSPTVAIILDQREAARIAPSTAALDGVDLGVYAAEQAFLTLLDLGTDVGLITYGERLTDVEPASDVTQRALVQSRLRAATDRYAAALGEADVEADDVVFQRLTPEPEMIEHHVPRNAQVMLLSPATDDFALEVSERLAAVGHPVTLLSPAVATTDSLGARRSRLDRACRLEAIRDQGTRVIDWQPGEPVQLAIARATRSGVTP